MAAVTTGEGEVAVPAASAPAGRVTWRRILLVLLLLGGGVLAAEHAMGGRTSMWVLAGIGAAAFLLFGLVRYPHLQRHFHPFGKRDRPRTQRASFSRTRTIRPPRLGSGRTGHRAGPRLGGGTGRRAAGGPRRAGLKLPPLRKGSKGGSRGPGLKLPGRKPGAGSSRGAGRRSGTGRRAGMFRPIGKSGRSGFRRRRAGMVRPAGRPGGAGTSRRGGLLRGAGRASGISRRGSKPGTRTAGTGQRRRLIRPSAWRRRGASTGTGRRPGTPQRLNRRQAWQARRTARRTAASVRPRRRITRPSTWRGRRHGWIAGPGGITRRWRITRPSTWRRPRTPAQQAKRIRRERSRKPGLARRGLYRIAGTPQQRHNRRAAARARRASRRAARIRRARSPYASRVRWFAPWRIWTRGPGARARFRRWRVQRARRVPRGRDGRTLAWRARIARRWRIWRGTHKGLGFGQRRASPLIRLAGMAGRARNAVARRWHGHRSRPPRPLARRWQPGWLNRILARADRRRQDRWAQRRRGRAPAPVRRPPAPVPTRARTSPNGNKTRGGPVADVHAAAEEIQGMIQSWIDANDLDQTLEDLHEIPRAIQEAFSNYAEQLRENTNLKEHIPEAVAEAAGSMAGIADSLQEAIGFGVQQS